MCRSTEVFIGMRQVGVPKSESYTDQSMPIAAAILQIAKYLFDNPVKGSRFDIRISTTKSETHFNEAAVVDLTSFESQLEALIVEADGHEG